MFSTLLGGFVFAVVFIGVTFVGTFVKTLLVEWYKSQF